MSQNLSSAAVVIAALRVKLTISDTVYVVADFGVSTPIETTVFVFHELLEAVTTQHFVLLVVTLVFF